MLVTLLFLLRRKIGSFDLASVIGTFGRMGIASVVAGLAAYGVVVLLTPILPGVLGSLVIVIVGGVVCFAVALGLGHVLGVREVAALAVLLGKLKSKFTHR